MKFIITITMLMLALLVTSIVAGIGTFLLAGISGQSLLPELNGASVSKFASDYVMAMVFGLIVMILMANYAAIASMLTRSVVGGTVAGMGIMVFEEFLLPILGLVSRLLNIPDLVQLYRITPTYNLKNISYWIQVGEPAPNQFFIDLAQPDPMLFSGLLLIAWCIGSLVLVVFLFSKQDITT